MEGKAAEFRTIRLTAKDTISYPPLPQLVALLNKAFVTSWATIPGLVGPDQVRYENSQIFLDDMLPDAILFVTLTDDSFPVALAAYKPWEPEWKQTARMVESEEASSMAAQATLQTDLSRPTYEITSVVVDPDWQSFGLASKLVKKAEKEIAEVTRKGGGSNYRIMVRAAKELVMRYWEKMDFATEREIVFKPGTIGSLSG